MGSQVFLAKLDANADTVWSTSQGGDGADRALFVDEASNHQIIVLGHWYGSTSAAEFYALKFEESILGVRDDLVSLVPDGYTLAQNYPNPFNPRTMIEFSLSRTSDVELDIYNVLGQRITTLLDGPMTPGDYQMPWDGQDSFGRAVASGLYFYRLRAGDFAASRKMILLK